MSSRVLKQFLQQRPGGYAQAAGRAGLPGSDAGAQIIPMPRHGRRSYAAAQVNRLTEGWTTIGLGANASLAPSIDNLRARSRQLYRDNEYARKFIKLCGMNIAGPDGFRYQARVYDDNGTPDTAANTALENAFNQFAAKGVFEITGKMSLRDVCRVLTETSARDGEFLVRVLRGTNARNAFGLAVQLLDVNRIDTQFNKTAQDGTNAIIMGVEVDAYLRPVAYHLQDRAALSGLAASPVNRQRILADEIIHGFLCDQPEQVRGVPWMHAAMLELNNLGAYKEAAVVASRLGASKMGFFYTENGEAEVLADGEDPGTGEYTSSVEAGTFDTLPPGVKFEGFDPNYPAAMFGDFVKANLRGVASGLMVSYHSLANDLEGVSFSSIRSGTLEERDAWMMLQAWFIDAFLEPLFAEWLRNALAFGLVKLPSGKTLPLEKIEKFRAHKFQGRRWKWVDPAKDIQADMDAMAAGVKSPQEVAANMGADLEDVLQEIAAANQLAKRYAVQLHTLKPPAPTGSMPADEPPTNS